ncbi:hypothetical protein MTO98_28460 [Mucilaginibacter sp. SMC90]|uniref:hypothetical protein n=1 Tax=Mucilaginibacter sp. SMC90 TaxID=2929803 RepID=UPI001FB566D7|nr:hypothetical protein [Mucilaginibacter sp. SMC90]UOE48346.1 hypothetical protein MTO98_28460 [Mucilaginibacter sp. SMC90]
MKNLLYLVLLCLTVTVNAQTKKKAVKTITENNPVTSSVPQVTDVIKGNVKNFTDKYWEMAVTGGFANYSITIPVDKDGNFNNAINIDEETEGLGEALR